MQPSWKIFIFPTNPNAKQGLPRLLKKDWSHWQNWYLSRALENPDEEAAKFINEQVKDIKEAMQGARDIIAEWVSENEQARNKVRQEFTETAKLSSKVSDQQKRRRGSTEIPRLF